MRRLICVSGLIAALVSPALFAELSKSDEKAIEKMLKQYEGQRFYMRMDAPAETGRHAYGTYTRPLVEVSPEGSNTDTDTAMTYSWWHAGTTHWGIRINDPVEIEDFDIDTDDYEVEVEFEGVGPAEDNDSAIKLVKIRSVADFEAAFNKTFSRAPLQDEHDDWSQDMKSAIAERRLVEGMNKRQVFYITGRPERFETSTKGGKEVETWWLRQDSGVKTGYWGGSSAGSTGLPSSIEFTDGVLTSISGTSGGGDQLSLD